MTYLTPHPSSNLFNDIRMYHIMINVRVELRDLPMLRAIFTPLLSSSRCRNYSIAMRHGAILLEFRRDKESVEGLVDGIRIVDSAARKTLDIEAGLFRTHLEPR
jgi:hypothetical protein